MSCKWEEAEIELARITKGRVVTDLTKQYKDIDIETDSYTYSVKHQTRVRKYNSLLFEVTLIDTDNGDSMDGSFLKCEADRYAIKFEDTWLMFDTKLLTDYINDNKSTLVKKTTQKYLEDANKASGRKYNRGVMYSLTPKQLINSNAFIWGRNYGDLK